MIAILLGAERSTTKQTDKKTITWTLQFIDSTGLNTKKVNWSIWGKIKICIGNSGIIWSSNVETADRRIVIYFFRRTSFKVNYMVTYSSTDWTKYIWWDKIRFQLKCFVLFWHKCWPYGLSWTIFVGKSYWSWQVLFFWALVLTIDCFGSAVMDI